MPRPLNLPEWATNPDSPGDLADPGALRKQTGYRLVGGVPEKPSYQAFNWYMNTTYKWVEYFSELTDAELTQLKNIDATTISATQWSYLAGLANVMRTTDASITTPTLTVSGLTASRVAVTGTGGLLASSNVTSTELSQLSGIGATTVAAQLALKANLAGATFSGAILGTSGTFSAALTAASFLGPSFDAATLNTTLTLGGTNANVINVGRAGATTNFFGDLVNIQTTNSQITDRLVTLNRGGGASTGGLVGWEIEENTVVTGYVRTSSGRTSLEIKVPGSSGTFSVSPNNNNFSQTIDSSTLTANRTYTLPDANGPIGNILQGGNSFGVPARIGTNDAFSTFLEAGGADRLEARVASAASADYKLNGTAGVELPVGTVTQRPTTPIAGTMRFNSETSEFEGYSSGAWQAVGGGLNEMSLKNYLRTYATGAISPGTIPTIAGATATIPTTAGVFYRDPNSGATSITSQTSTTLRGTSNYITAVGSPTVAGDRFVQFPAFSLDTVDLGKNIQISFDVTGLTVGNSWDVVVVRYNSAGVFQNYIAVSGYASQCTATPSAQILTGTTSQKGFFAATSTAGDLYAIRFRRLAGTEQITLDTLYAGPHETASSPAITDWQTYTGTVAFAGTGVFSHNKRQWRRVNDSIEIEFVFGVTTAGTGTGYVGIPLPPGVTVDTTKLVNDDVLGFYQLFSASTYQFGGVVRYASAQGVVTHIALSKAGTDAILAGSHLTAGQGYYIRATIPVANWGSSVTLLDRSTEEYAFNTSTATGGDSVSFGYGPQGSLVPNITQSLAATTAVYRVRFGSPIQPTDSVILEVGDANGTWTQVGNYAAQIAPFSYNGGRWFGIFASRVAGSSTDYEVIFGTAGALNLGVYSSATAADYTTWTNRNAAGFRYRLRKIAANSLVGIGPLSARNIVGDITTPAAGQLGEILTGTNVTTNNITAGTYYTASSVTLTPGVWLVSGKAYFQAPSGTDKIGDAVAGLLDSAGSPDVSALGFDRKTDSAGGAGGAYVVVSVNRPFVVNVTTIIYLRAQAVSKTGTINIPSGNQALSALRIA